MFDLLKSKKFQAAVIGVVVVVAKHFVPELPEDAVVQVLAVLIAYIIGQGVADAGKEAAKINGKE